MARMVRDHGPGVIGAARLIHAKATISRSWINRIPVRRTPGRLRHLRRPRVHQRERMLGEGPRRLDHLDADLLKS